MQKKMKYYFINQLYNYDFNAEDDTKEINDKDKEDNKVTKNDTNVSIHDNKRYEDDIDIVSDKFHTDRKNEQLSRIKMLKNVITLEEYSVNNMYELEYYNKNYTALEKIAKGSYKNAITQTSDKLSTSVQTKSM